MPISVEMATREFLRLLALQGYRGVPLELTDHYEQHQIEVAYDCLARMLSIDEFSEKIISPAVNAIFLSSKIGLLLVSNPLPDVSAAGYYCANESFAGIAVRGIMRYDLITDQIQLRWEFMSIQKK